jgi:ABC-type uncharacterized transport system involved in gliding motility auxiliary subunit
MLNRILGIVGWLGTALVFAAVAVRVLRPAWDQYAQWAAIAGLVCVLLYTLSQWREVARSFRGRQARFGTMAGVGIAAVLGILVIANYLATQQGKRWDLTVGGAFSVSDQTLKILHNLDGPVKARVFDQTQNFSRFRDRLNEYERASKNFSVDYIDADRQPALTRQYQVQSYGTVVFEYKGRTERAMSDSEQDLTNGLIKVLSGKQLKVYFVQGHGEKDTTTTASNRSGYNGVSLALGRDNYSVERLVLAQQTDVPADATVVVVAGPTNDYLPQEVAALRSYLRKGGKVLFLMDPPGDAKSPPLVNLEGLLTEFSVQLGRNIVVDVSGVGQLLGTDASVPVAASYPSHPITERFNLLTAYPLARSVTGMTGSSGAVTPQTFIETSPRSWAESDIKALTSGVEIAMDEAAGDQKGPVSIGVAMAEAAPDRPAPPAAQAGAQPPPTPETRLVVVGDSDFAANSALGIGGNADMFVNIVNWLAQQENLIAIRPREPGDRRITLTADQQRGIMWLVLLVLPGLILGSGVYTWWQRR